METTNAPGKAATRPPHSLREATTPPVHLRLRDKLEAHTERLALRAALNAAHLLGLATGTFLRELRNADDPLTKAAARVKEAQLQARLAWEIVEILGARLDKLPEHQRPYYTPVQRFRILEIKNLLGWNRDLIARLFRVCSNTISNWERAADPTTHTVGSTVRPVPPIVRIADVARRLVQTMLQFGIGGEEMVAQALARAGWTLSARSVRRIGKEGRTSAPEPPPPPPTRPNTTPVIASFVGHVLMMDVTVVQSFLGGDLYLAAAFSRVPIATATYEKKPGASAMARLLKLAAKALGRSPKYVITDQGPEFKGKVFEKTASRMNVLHRYGSIQNIFATARLERFWKTLKDTASLRLLRPLNLQDLERRLELALTHFTAFRPHQGLHGATPAEIFLGLEPLAKKAIKPPRGRPGEAPAEPPAVVGFLDPDRRAFPFLKAA